MNTQTLLPLANPVKRTNLQPADMDRALELGADELMNRIEFTLSNRPRALQSARKIYRRACRKLFGALERHHRGSEQGENHHG